MRYTSRGMRRRGNTDKWEVRLSHKDPITGKLLSTYHTVEAKTEKSAKKKRSDLIYSLNKRGAAIDSKMTIDELVEMLITHKENNSDIEDSTIYHYKRDANYISKYIGNIRLADLGIQQIDDWIAQMQEDGYAPRTIKKPFRLLSQAMKFAMQYDLITKNPCLFCKTPKIERKKVNVLIREERTRMLKIAVDALNIPVHLAIAIALTTGLRGAEVCGLRFSDIGDDETITVNRSIGRRSGGYYVKPPKTEASHRTIPLDHTLYEHLISLNKESKEERREFDPQNWDPYILGTYEPESRFLQPCRLDSKFHDFTELHGFKCTFHDLRHTFATMLISSGVDVRTVAALLGHSNVKETLDTYAEADPEAKRAALSKIQDSFDINLANVIDFPAVKSEPKIAFTIEELEAILEELKKEKNGQTVS